MKIISWNVNGLRANAKKGGFDWILAQNADVFCFQETKAHPDQLPENVRNPQGYHSFFDHSKVRKGYSGVAIYSKVEPDSVDYGMGIEEFDQEGRMLAAFFGKIVVITAYFPNGGGGQHRLEYKLRFYDAFLLYIDKLKKKGYGIVFCGDVNTAHTEIDLARPKENKENTGFLPIEREWIDQVIDHGYVDIFREKNPRALDVYTYWDMKTAARERNVGWRIDYFFISRSLVESVKNVVIHSDIFGSDHCPIAIEIKKVG